MTETVDSAQDSNGRVRSGLRIERVYTNPDVHPYEEVNWQRRDVVLTNWCDGSINFEQRCWCSSRA